MIKDSRDNVLGALTSVLAVHNAHKDFHSAFMVLLALGQVRPLAEHFSSEEEEEEEETWVEGEKVALQLQLFSRAELDNELEVEIEFRLDELYWAWGRECEAGMRLETLIQVDEVIQACLVARRNDLVKGAMPGLERLFLFNHADQAEISVQVGELLKDHPRDGKWGELLRGIVNSKENITLAKDYC